MDIYQGPMKVPMSCIMGGVGAIAVKHFKLVQLKNVSSPAALKMQVN